MSPSETKDYDPLKQIHLPPFGKELQVRTPGGLKHLIPSSNHQQLGTIRIYGPRWPAH